MGWTTATRTKPAPVGAVEVARADQQTARRGQRRRPGPRRRPAVRAPDPEVEAARPAGWAGTRPTPSTPARKLEPLPVAVPLDVDVVVVGEGHRAGGLDRAGHHQPGVLAHVEEEADQLGVAGVEAGPHPGQVGALGQRVDGDHALGPRRPASSGGGPSQVNSA